MNPNQTIAAKRQFFAWFLRTQQLKYPPAAAVLQEIMENQELLVRVRFVTDISGMRTALSVSALGTDGHPFLCRVEDSYYYLPQEAIAGLLQSTSVLYVCLNYERCFPCTVPGLVTAPEAVPAEDFAQLAEAELEARQEQKEAKIKLILAAIDDALDRGDKQAFRLLSSQYKELKEGT